MSTNRQPGSTWRKQRGALARSLYHLGAGACLGWLALGPVALGHGQQPAAAPAEASNRTILRSNNIKLPIEISPASVPTLDSVHLFVKEGGASASWVHKDKVSPTQSFFLYKAPRDGEYWFNIVSVNRRNEASPANLDTAPPALIVVVDTQPPQVDVKVLGAQSDGLYLQVEVHDQNPDPAQTQAYFQTQNQSWHQMESTAPRRDVYCIPSQANTTGLVKIMATDLAKNMTVREINLATLSEKAPAPQVAAQPAPRPMPEPNPIDSVVPAGAKVVAEKVTYLDKNGQPLSPAQQLELEQSAGYSAPIEPVTTTQIGAYPQPSPVVTPQAHPQPSLVVAPQGPGYPYAAPATAPAPLAVQAPPAEPATPRQLVNDTKVYLDYAVDGQGSGGVGKVDIWCTRDRGRTWQFLCTDTKKQSPAEVKLPEEGLFGLKLAIANSRGFGAEAPKTGDEPDWWIEVDRSPPKVKLSDLRTGSREDNFAVHIRWTAEDKNLGDEPIELYYANQREGPWHLIARGLKAESEYRWNAPPEAGKEVFFRVVARDRAGNAALSELTRPWPLDDGTRPLARIKSVTTTPPNQVQVSQEGTVSPNRLDVTSMPVVPLTNTSLVLPPPPMTPALPPTPVAPAATFQPVEYRR